MMKSAFKAIASILVIVTLLFALCGDLMPAVITPPANAQQNRAEELSTAAENWEKDRENIERVPDIIVLLRMSK